MGCVALHLLLSSLQLLLQERLTFTRSLDTLSLRKRTSGSLLEPLPQLSLLLRELFHGLVVQLHVLVSTVDGGRQLVEGVHDCEYRENVQPQADQRGTEHRAHARYSSDDHQVPRLEVPERDYHWSDGSY